MENNENHYPYKRKYNVGDVVLISDSINYNTGYSGQAAVIVIADIMNYPVNSEDYYLPDYYVVAYDSRAQRFWSCGFQEKDLKPLGFKIDGLIESYARWLSDRCWSNTEPQIRALFDDFMKSLKKIRKKYKQEVEERT